MNILDSVIYRINLRDEIVFVNDLWDHVATADGNLHLPGWEILGLQLWRFIRDYSSRDLYKYIVKTVRDGKPTQFNYRCDTPEDRRLMEMRITLCESDEIHIGDESIKWLNQTAIINSKSNSPLTFLQHRQEKIKCIYPGIFRP